MSRRPWMPFYVEDFRLDTLDLGPDEIGVYFIMICLAWRRGDGSVPGDMDQLKTMLQRCLAHFHGHTFNRIVPKLLERYFQKQDDLWYQKRVVNELQKADKLSAKQSQIANKRWSKDNKTKDIDNANALPLQLQSQLQKKDAPSAPSNPEKELFDRGKQVLGNGAGGLIAKLLKAKGSVAQARAAIEQASEKSNPREYVSAIVNAKPREGEFVWKSGIPGVL